MAATFTKPIDDEVPWEQRLANYAKDTNAGKTEYQRALEVYRGKSAIGDTEGAAAAQKWANQVNTAIGGTGNQQNDEIKQTLQQYRDNIAKPVQTFTYDQNSDPGYQAALSQAKANSATAEGNIAAALNKRGIMNSTITADRASQAAQQEMGRVSTEIAPQLRSQAYAEYRDRLNSEQQQNQNLLGYANVLNGINQQDKDNQYRDTAFEEQQKQNNWNAYLQNVAMTGNLSDGAKKDYSLLGKVNGELSLAGKQYQDTKEQQAYENNLRQQQLEQSAQQFAASQGLDWARLSQSQQQYMMEMAFKQKQFDAENDPNGLDYKYKQAQIDNLTGKNIEDPNSLDYKYKQAQIDALTGKNGSPPKVSDKDSSDNYSAIMSDLNSEDFSKIAKQKKKTDKQLASELLQANRDLLTDSDYRKVLEYIDKTLQ